MEEKFERLIKYEQNIHEYWPQYTLYLFMMVITWAILNGKDGQTLNQITIPLSLEHNLTAQ